MSKVHVSAMDTHSQTTDICVKTRANGPGKHYRVKTTIPEIAGVIEQVGRPRELVFEEGPLAGWLLRNLRGRVEQAVSCDPRKNALIARDGDKDDPIDASKLCDLHLGGFTRAVHHAESVAREVAICGGRNSEYNDGNKVRSQANEHHITAIADCHHGYPLRNPFA